MCLRASEPRGSAALAPVVTTGGTSEAIPAGARPPEGLSTCFFEGECAGRILEEARGAQGFGYDPFFVPEGYAQTFAELGDAVKNELSHRAKAVAGLRAWFAAYAECGTDAPL